ncbi:MAG: TonB-dependent receptor, partial [Myxococcota bacterium]
QRFRFDPARRDGEPLAARIGYRYVFTPPPPAPPPEIIEEMVEEIVEEVEEEEVAPESLLASAAAAEEEEISFGAEALVDPPPRSLTRRTIRREELTRVAGTRGDPLRTIEILPGVARPPAGAGLLIIRGSAPNDSQVYLDGTPIPLLYHFGGLTSFMNGRLIDQIDFYPSNFTVRYGRKIGGVVEVSGRDPAVDRFRGVADLNLLDASILIEAPITDELAFAAAARRSYADIFFDAVIPDDAFDVVAAPVYWDYQTYLTWNPTPNDRIRVRAYGSSDEIRFLFEDPGDGDPAFRGNLNVRTWFHRFDTSWRHRYSDDVTHRVLLSAGPTHVEFDIGQNASFDNDLWEINARAEWDFRLSDAIQLRTGLDIALTPFDITYRGVDPGQGEGNIGGGPGGDVPGSAQDLVGVTANLVYFRPAVFLEAELRPIDSMRIIPGVRVDRFDSFGDDGGIDALTVDPRIAATLELSDSFRIKGGAGMFTQPPEANESSRGIGNRDLEPIRALHVGAGFAWDITDQISVDIEGFYKRLYDRVVQTSDGLEPRFTNDGTGDIYGMEVSARIQPQGNGLFGFLSYTLSRSERIDRGEARRLFDFDQPHVLNLALGYRLPAGWEVSGTFRLASGNPTTPIGRGLYDADSDLYLPIFGQQNSARDSLFHRLDLRVEKQWVFDDWKFALYLDVQNVYNRQNQEGISYSFDFSEQSVVSGLPIIPSLGVRGEL